MSPSRHRFWIACVLSSNVVAQIVDGTATSKDVRNWLGRGLFSFPGLGYGEEQSEGGRTSLSLTPFHCVATMILAEVQEQGLPLADSSQAIRTRLEMSAARHAAALNWQGVLGESRYVGFDENSLLEMLPEEFDPEFRPPQTMNRSQQDIIWAIPRDPSSGRSSPSNLEVRDAHRLRAGKRLGSSNEKYCVIEISRIVEKVVGGCAARGLFL